MLVVVGEEKRRCRDDGGKTEKHKIVISSTHAIDIPSLDIEEENLLQRFDIREKSSTPTPRHVLCICRKSILFLSSLLRVFISSIIISSDDVPTHETTRKPSGWGRKTTLGGKVFLSLFRVKIYVNNVIYFSKQYQSNENPNDLT